MYYKDTLVQNKILLMNDRYNIPSTIKDDEHDRRDAKHSHSHNNVYSPIPILNSQEKLNSMCFLSTIPIEFVIKS